MEYFIRTTKKEGRASLYCRIRKPKWKINTTLRTDLSVDINAWNKSQRSANAWNQYAQTDEGKHVEETMRAIDESINFTVEHGIRVRGVHRTIEVDGAYNKQILEEAIKTITNRDLLARQKEYKESVKVARPKENTLVAFTERYILECQTGERLKHETNAPISASYIKNLKAFRNQILEFQKAKHKVLGLDDITMDFYKSFRQFFLDKKYSPNTIARHIRDLKTLMRAACDEKLTANTEWQNRSFSAKSEDVDNIWLTDDQVQQMYALDITTYDQAKALLENVKGIDEEYRKSLQHALKREVYRINIMNARDIFIVGCLTGQRVSDYKRINVSMIEKLAKAGKFLNITQQKTGKKIYVPLDVRVEKILSRHGGRLPKMFDQHLNDHIKVVGLLCGWTHPAHIEQTRGGMTYDNGKKFYECIMTHTARRTFATSWYKKDVPLSAIMTITGHSSEAMLRRYLKLNDQEKGRQAAIELAQRGFKQAK